MYIIIYILQWNLFPSYFWGHYASDINKAAGLLHINDIKSRQIMRHEY